MAIASPAVPGTAEAVKQSGRTDVKVTGLGLPNEPYLKDGVVDSVVLWNTMDLGYLTLYAANGLPTSEEPTPPPRRRAFLAAASDALDHRQQARAHFAQLWRKGGRIASGKRRQVLGHYLAYPRRRVL